MITIRGTPQTRKMAKHAAGCRDRTPREPEYRARKPAVANCALKAPIEMSTSFLRPHCAHDRQPTGIAAAIYGGQGGILWRPQLRGREISLYPAAGTSARFHRQRDELRPRTKASFDVSITDIASLILRRAGRGRLCSISGYRSLPRVRRQLDTDRRFSIQARSRGSSRAAAG